MAELHVKLHTNPVQVDIPRQRQRLIDKINAAKALPEALKSKALIALEAMPDGDRLCHGDFHPGNILVTLHEEMIIDWTDVTRGNPLADLARTTILFCGSAEASHSRYSLIRAFLLKIHGDYIRHYFRLRPGGEEEYRRWLPIIAAARLSENIPEVEKWLISQAEMGL